MQLLSYPIQSVISMIHFKHGPTLTKASACALFAVQLELSMTTSLPTTVKHQSVLS